MPNHYFSEVNKMKQSGGSGVKPTKPGSRPSSLKMKTAAWPSSPGKGQPRSRNTMGGATAVKQYAKSEGL